MLLASAFVFAASMTLYVATLAPGLLWGGGDFARFQTWAYLGHIEGKVDIFAHPLWVYAAHPFTWLPIRDPAWRANLASAVFASLALVFVFLSASHLTRSRPAALLATATLAVSHTFWTYAVMPKVYSLNALLLAACIYLLLHWRASHADRFLYAFAWLYGFSFLNHLVMSTAAAGFAAFIVVTMCTVRGRGERVLPRLLVTTGWFVGGLFPYLYLVARSEAAAGTLGTIVTFLNGLLHVVGHFTTLARGCGLGVLLGLYQFPITAVVGVVGLYQLWRSDSGVAALVTLILIGTLAFLLSALGPGTALTYGRDCLHYYLQAYVPFALALAVGFDAVWTRWCCHQRMRQAVVIVLTLASVPLYAAAPAIARRMVSNIPEFRSMPGRDNFRYVLSPWKQNETGARDYGMQVLQALPAGSVLFADYGPWSVIRYLQVVESLRLDVDLVQLGGGSQVADILAHGAKPALFLVDTNRYYDLAGIRQHFDIVPAGPIYRLLPNSTPR